MFWNGAWLETPSYTAVPGSVLLTVDRSAVLLSLGDATGRTIRRPLRKFVAFVIVEGPAAAWRKAKVKRAASALTRDYHAVLVAGRDGSGHPVLALCLRAPRCSQQVLAHRDLVVTLDSACDARQFSAAAAHLARALRPRHAALRESYLYSGRLPPDAIKRALQEAVRAAPGPAPGPRVHVPPPLTGGRPHVRPRPTATGGITVLGAGDYVRTEVLPSALRAGLPVITVCDREPQIAAYTAASVGAALCVTDPDAAIDSAPRGLVIVATAHDSHARLASRALEAGHHVILEKPPVVTQHDLTMLLGAMDRHPGKLTVGFNRRHNPLIVRAGEMIARASGPVTVNMIVRKLDLDPDHWYLWPNQGTGITGNATHWIDLGVMFTQAWPTRVLVTAGGDLGGPEPSELTVTTHFDDDSFVLIHATGNGDATRGVTERLEARRGGVTVQVDDMRELRTYAGGVRRRRRLPFRTRGHTAMYDRVFAAFAAGRPLEFPRRQLIATATIQIAAAELARRGGGSRDLEAERAACA